MIVSIQIEEENFRVDVANPLDISIPLNFYGAQPNAYGVEKASAQAYETGALVGDTRRGGSCNFEKVSFVPHCTGTHTECVGHITHERISIRDSLHDAFIPAVLITVEPENARETQETYAAALNETDKLITKKSLENALEKLKTKNPNPQIRKPKAIVVRTLPNDDGKLSRTYLEKIPPFFSNDAMLFFREKGVEHLLCDLPSIDRLFDEGKLSNHRIFWSVEQGSFEISEKSSVHNTITELIYVPDEISDGEYLLNLQIAPFASDASPSRPVLFKIYE
jgi:Putative cyclase.